MCWVLSAVAIAACGGSAEEKGSSAENPIRIEGVALPGLDELAPNQRAAFEDGEISTVEYAEAYRMFEACANSAGLAVVDPQVDPVSGYISYGIFEEVGGVLEDPTSDTGRCYENEFHWVELVWEATDPTYTQQQRELALERFETEARPCLVANGVDVPVVVELDDDAYLPLLQEWIALSSASKC